MFKAFIREKIIADLWTITKQNNFGSNGFVVESKEQAWVLFGISTENQHYYDVMLIPYSGKKLPGTKIKRVISYR